MKFLLKATGILFSLLIARVITEFAILNGIADNICTTLNINNYNPILVFSAIYLIVAMLIKALYKLSDISFFNYVAWLFFGISIFAILNFYQENQREQTLILIAGVAIFVGLSNYKK